ncbi:MAG: potassium channel family protein, partial [Planctomycetaceae bacterium]
MLHRGTPASADDDRSGFLILLLSLLVMLIIIPNMVHTSLARFIMHLGTTAIFLSSIFAHRSRPRVFRSTLTLACVTLPITWSTMLSTSGELHLVSYFLGMLFYLTTAVLTLITVLAKHRDSVRGITGAVCAYLLLGLAWALGYSCIEYCHLEYVQVEPFEFGHRLTQHRQTPNGAPLTEFSQWIYFSFVTMSTLGYGDIAPRTSVAQTVTWMQSVVGQFYLAVLVSWLVGSLHLPRRGSSDEDFK